MGSWCQVYWMDKNMNRDRIKGTGPDRKKLKTYYKMGNVSFDTVRELNAVLNSRKGSDIGTDEYSIANQIDYKKTHNALPDKYRQILLQNKEMGEEDEFSYSNWKVDDYKIDSTVCDIYEFFDSERRFRVSEMQPNHELSWHIDTNTSVACRAQICLNDHDATFEFKDRDGHHIVNMEPGELWFVNTGWPHRVVTNNLFRRAAVFTFHFDNVLDKGSLLINS